MTRSRPISLLPLLWMASPAWLAVALYGYAVQLPFFRDDLVLIPLLAEINGLEQWFGSSVTRFYRPAAYMLWSLFTLPDGTPHAPVFHWANVLALALCAVLAGQVVRLFGGGGAVTAGLVGHLVVVYPFTYEAVVWVSSFFHLAAGVGVLLSLYGLLRYARGSALPWLILACAAAVIGVFSQENGFLLLAFGVGLVLLKLGVRRVLLAVLPLGGVALVYPLVWFSLPRAAGDVGLPPGVLPRLMNLLQGTSYPANAALAALVEGRTPATTHTLIALTLLVPLAAWVITPHKRIMLAGAFAWFVLAVLPSALLLEQGYVLGAPRLSFLASFGVAAFWGIAAGVAWRYGWGWRLLMAAYLLALVVVGGRFLLDRRADFIRLADYSHSLFALGDHPRFVLHNARMLLVNAPQGLVPYEGQFLSGSEGAMIMQPTFRYNSFYRFNQHLYTNSQPFDTIRYVGHQIPQRPDVFFAPYGSREVGGEELYRDIRESQLSIVTDFERGRFAALAAGWPLPGRADLPPPMATFAEPGLTLHAPRATLEPDGRFLRLEADWVIDQPGPYKMFVHVLCDGVFVGQEDGYAVGDLYPFAGWPAGQGAHDARRVALAPRVADPACLSIYTGVYREIDGTRLRALAPDGDRYPDDRVPVPLVP